MKIRYKDIKLSADSRKLVDTCNAVIDEYLGQGFVLTLRQLYYQLVSRDIIANRQTEYKRLGSIVNDARLAGLIDWRAIEDRTRNLRQRSHWKSPESIVEACARQFWMDHWEGQPWRPEVWIEKDALVGVIEGVCEELDVPFFSCRGYTSQSEMWVAGQRLHLYQNSGQAPLIFHLGDHDPSGKDMTRDISDRLALFMGGTKLERLALNMDQIQEHNPPPNPAKITDSRAQAYITEFGDDSWELDALEPRVIAALIRSNIEALIDWDKWTEKVQQMERLKVSLRQVAANWDDAVAATE